MALGKRRSLNESYGQNPNPFASLSFTNSIRRRFYSLFSLIAMDEMEDIEDMARDPVDNAPLGLHLPQQGRSNGTNGVAIKPRRRIAANFGAIREDLSSLSVTGTTEGGAKVPGTQVSLADQIFP